MLRPSGAESELYCLFGQRFGSGAYLSKGSTGESLCFLLCGQFEFGEPGTHEGIEPGENLLHVRYVDPVAVHVLNQEKTFFMSDTWTRSRSTY